MLYLVGIEPLALGPFGRARPIIQNIGPGDVYLDTDQEASTSSGLRIKPGEALSFSGPAATETGIWLVASEANTDVRVVLMGEA